LSLLAISNTGEYAVATNYGRGLTLDLDPQTLEPINRFQSDSSVLTDVAFTQENNLMVGVLGPNLEGGSGLNPEVIALIDPLEPEVLSTIQVNEGSPRRLILNASDSGLLALVGPGNPYFGQSAPSRIWHADLDLSRLDLVTREVTPVEFSLISSITDSSGDYAYIFGWEDETDRNVFVKYSWSEARIVEQEYINAGREALGVIPGTDYLLLGDKGGLQIFDPNNGTVISAATIAGDNVRGAVLDENGSGYVLSEVNYGDESETWISPFRIVGLE